MAAIVFYEGVFVSSVLARILHERDILKYFCKKSIDKIMRIADTYNREIEDETEMAGYCSYFAFGSCCFLFGSLIKDGGEEK